MRLHFNEEIMLIGMFSGVPMSWCCCGVVAIDTAISGKDDDDGGLPLAVIGGIVAGVVGLLLLILIIVIVVRCRRRRTRKYNQNWQWSVGHGSWVKWVNRSGWVTLVMGQYSWPVDPRV